MLYLCNSETLKKKKDSHFTYLITYGIFTFKVWFENNLHRSIMRVLYCAIGFCKEMNERRMKTFYLNNMQQTETRIQMIKWQTNSNSPSFILYAQIQCRSVHARGFTAGQKNCGKSGLGHRAFGPSRALGLRAAVL